MRKPMADFPAWGELDAAAILGNIGGETGGFKLMQVKPFVKGSRGSDGDLADQFVGFGVKTFFTIPPQKVSHRGEKPRRFSGMARYD